MKHPYEAMRSITINTGGAKVWDALTKPELVKQYLFGTDMIADWRVGGNIIYRGEWEGKSYEDKGTVIAIEPKKLLKTTYFSKMSGMEDKPENYHTVSYELIEKGGKTILTVRQDNIATKESADHSGENWGMVLHKLKELLEK